MITASLPTEALDTDVVSFRPTGCPISNSVLQLVEAGSPSDPAIEFTAIFYGNPAVLRKPPHIGGEAVDVEMFTVEVGALLFSEVSLACQRSGRSQSRAVLLIPPPHVLEHEL